MKHFILRTSKVRTTGFLSEIRIKKKIPGRFQHTITATYLGTLFFKNIQPHSQC